MPFWALFWIFLVQACGASHKVTPAPAQGATGQTGTSISQIGPVLAPPVTPIPETVVAGVPSKRVFRNLPSLVIQNSIINPGTGLIIGLQDTHGIFVKSQLFPGVVLTLSGPQGNLLGTVAQSFATEGVNQGFATFTNLSVSNIGQGFTLNATANTLTGTSSPFNVALKLNVTGPSTVISGVCSRYRVSLSDGLTPVFVQANPPTLVAKLTQGSGTFGSVNQNCPGAGLASAAFNLNALGFADFYLNAQGQGPLVFELASQSPSTVIDTSFTSSPIGVVTSPGSGSLDTTFNGTGKLANAVSGFDAFGVVDLKVDASNRIIAAGTGFSFTTDASVFAVSRLTAAGSFDSTFAQATNGFVSTSFNDPQSLVSAIQLLPNGKIVVAGQAEQKFGIAQYNQDGSLDSAFNQTGKLTTGSNSSIIVGLGLTPTGQLMFAGDAQLSFAIARLTALGTLDSSFGGGVVLTNQGANAGSAQANAIAVDQQGNSIVVGIAQGNTAGIVRYLPSGAVDTTFNGGQTNTIVQTQALNTLQTVEVTGDGKIVAGGSATDFTTGNNVPALARYLNNGQLDTTFNKTGIVTTPISGANAAVSDLALAFDGKIVVTLTLDVGDFYVARYNADGSLDTGFNNTGSLRVPLQPNGDSKSRAVAIAPDGKIVVGGTSLNNSQFTLLRIWP